MLSTLKKKIYLLMAKGQNQQVKARGGSEDEYWKESALESDHPQDRFQVLSAIFRMVGLVVALYSLLLLIFSKAVPAPQSATFLIIILGTTVSLVLWVMLLFIKTLACSRKVREGVTSVEGYMYQADYKDVVFSALVGLLLCLYLILSRP